MKAVRKAIDAEDIIKCMDNGENNISWTTKRQQSPIISKLQWLLLCHLRNPLLKTISILLVLFSLIVIWSECIFSVDKPVMSIFALMISPEKVRSSDIYVTLTLFGPLLYLIVCSYWSLFQLRIFRYYRLIPGQHSDANSIIFSAAYLCRLAAPLALNFIHMLKLEGTMFQEVMSSMTEIPIIGNSLFNEYAPVGLILVCAFFLFDVLGRVSMCCDCTKYSYSDPLLNDSEIEYGKTIVCDERRLWTNGTHKDSTTENLGDLETGKLVPKREHTPEPTSKYMAKMFGNSRPTIDEKDLSDEENMESGSTNSGRYTKQGGFKRGGGWKKIS